MKLHAMSRNGCEESPWVVWLHGFLGSAGEWGKIADAFANRQLLVDLPGHGGSQHIQVSGFADADRLLKATLLSYNILDYWLVGYSLGGRLGMYHASRGHAGLRGLVVEGGHPGLVNKTERRVRYAADRQQAACFRTRPFVQVLNDWYRQPVFASLTVAQREAVIAHRLKNNPSSLAAMLEATSLGRQPDLRNLLAAAEVPIHYLCGEHDSRFQALAPIHGAHHHTIPAAGHNAHWENPQGFCACLSSIFATNSRG